MCRVGGWGEIRVVRKLPGYCRMTSGLEHHSQISLMRRVTWGCLLNKQIPRPFPQVLGTSGILSRLLSKMFQCGILVLGKWLILTQAFWESLLSSSTSSNPALRISQDWKSIWLFSYDRGTFHITMWSLCQPGCSTGTLTKSGLADYSHPSLVSSAFPPVSLTTPVSPKA